ncbi:hypothetical protein [Streptomyces sp. NPDC094468]|uniref:hypothetical protein n=1 Tax=Streptomyces sp. NPDC094468 TaxID=3366066 RepID=UPI003801B129
MSTAPGGARDTPVRTPARQQLSAVLHVDMERRRAHFDCYRPGCPKPHEEPIKPSVLHLFINGIKARHMSQYHPAEEGVR